MGGFLWHWVGGGQPLSRPSLTKQKLNSHLTGTFSNSKLPSLTFSTQNQFCRFSVLFLLQGTEQEVTSDQSAWLLLNLKWSISAEFTLKTEKRLRREKNTENVCLFLNLKEELKQTFLSLSSFSDSSPNKIMNLRKNKWKEKWLFSSVYILKVFFLL